MSLRLKKRGEKALEKALGSVSPEDDSGSTGAGGSGSGKRWKGYPEEETIPEGEEPPPTPGPRLTVRQREKGRETGDSRSSSRHRRESAET